MNLILDPKAAREMETSIPRLVESLTRRGVRLSEGETGLSVEGEAGAAERRALEARAPEVLAYLRARKAAGARAFAPTPGAPVGPALIQDMWWGWVHGLQTQMPHERLAVAVPLEGAEAAVVETALRALVARHATLRARFLPSAEGLGLTLNDAEDFPVETLAAPEDGPLEEALERVRLGLLGIRMPIEGPWLGAGRVLTRGGRVAGAALVFHHMVLDARSLVLLDKELRRLVEAGGDAAVLGPAPAQFVEYGPWERGWLAREGRALVDWWRGWLAGAPRLKTPGGAPLRWAPGEKVYYDFTLAGAAVDRLRRLTSSASCTVFTAVLAAVGLAGARWSGQGRFPVRVIGDLRTSRALASMVGNLVCTDLVDMRVEEAGDVQALLRETAAEYTAACRLRVPNLLGLADSPAFPDAGPGSIGERTAVTLNYLPIYAFRGAAAAEGEIEPHLARMAQTEHWPRPMCPINLRVWDYGPRLYAKLEFNADLIGEAEQRRFGELFAAALVELAEAGADA